MVIVDAHCHVSQSWYEPVEVLLAQMDRNGVNHAVLIQMQGQFNNSYQAECLRRYPGRFASVALVDPSAPDAPETLRRLVDEGASGVRLNATTRSPGSDPLLIWREAERLGLAVSCAGAASDFAAPEFAALVETLPGLTIVLEHLGSLSRPDRAERGREDRQSVFALVRFPNVFMKITGLGEFCERASPVTEPNPFVQPEPDLLAQAVSAFGPQRLMWGSDYPPVSAREGFANALRLPMARIRAIQGVSDADVERIFGGTALAVFPVRG
jgi:L-fuconolactonase